VKKTKRAKAAPPTLAALYREITGDTDAHQGTIAAHFRQLDTRRQRLVNRRLKGQTMAYIGESFGISSAATQSSIVLSMRAIRKAIAGLPRYHLVGRPTGYTRKDHRAPKPADIIERVYAGAETRRAAAAKKARR
jgi:hypothetical protein